MKVGEELAVSIAGMEVGAGIIEDLTDGVVTIVIPATRVRMGVRQSLEPLAPSGRETLLTEDKTLLEQTPPSEAQNGVLSEEQSTGAPVASNQSQSQENANTQASDSVSLKQMEFDSSAID